MVTSLKKKISQNILLSLLIAIILVIYIFYFFYFVKQASYKKELAASLMQNSKEEVQRLLSMYLISEQMPGIQDYLGKIKTEQSLTQIEILQKREQVPNSFVPCNADQMQQAYCNTKTQQMALLFPLNTSGVTYGYLFKAKSLAGFWSAERYLLLLGLLLPLCAVLYFIQLHLFKSFTRIHILQPMQMLSESIKLRLVKGEEKTPEFRQIEYIKLWESIDGILRECEALRKNEKELAASAAIGNMTHQIIHDIAGPLHSINVASNYLTKLKKEDQFFSDHVQLLELGSKRLALVADGLLKNHGQKIDEKKHFSLHEVIHQLQNEYSLQNKGLQLMVELPNHAVELFGTQVKLQRAIGNIIKNAIEAMKGIGTIKISVTASGENVIISITDNGPGMSSDTLLKVLKGSYTAGKFDGHGIGMKVVRETVEEFGGALTAQSELGKGTSFMMSFPLLLQKQHERGDGLKVLVIDDDEGICVAWKLLKQQRGIDELHTFASMEECEAKQLNYADFDVAFVDKNIEKSDWSLENTLRWLKKQGLPRAIIASGEPLNVVRTDVAFHLADGCSSPEKIPADITQYL